VSIDQAIDAQVERETMLDEDGFPMSATEPTLKPVPPELSEFAAYVDRYLAHMKRADKASKRASQPAGVNVSKLIYGNYRVWKGYTK